MIPFLFSITTLYSLGLSNSNSNDNNNPLNTCIDNAVNNNGIELLSSSSSSL